MPTSTQHVHLSDNQDAYLNAVDRLCVELYGKSGVALLPDGDHGVHVLQECFCNSVPVLDAIKRLRAEAIKLRGKPITIEGKRIEWHAITSDGCLGMTELTAKGVGTIWQALQHGALSGRLDLTGAEGQCFYGEWEVVRA